jgi:hypothetical protein
LARERERLGLFAKQLLAEQETAEDRIRRIDAENLRHDHSFRDLAAKHWREARRLLRSMLPDIQAEVLQSWNRSSVPPDAAYFVDFVRSQLRRRGILGSHQGASSQPSPA